MLLKIFTLWGHSVCVRETFMYTLCQKNCYTGDYREHEIEPKFMFKATYRIMRLRSVVSVGRCPSRFYGRWSFHWYWRALTTAMRRWLDYLALSSTRYSQWWMPVHYLNVRHGSSSTSRRCSADWVEAIKLAVLVYALPTWHSSAVPGTRAVLCDKHWLATYGDCTRHLRQRLTFHRLVASPSETVLSALLALVCGTACHLTSLHRRHSPVSSNDWKRCCFNVHFTVGLCLTV